MSDNRRLEIEAKRAKLAELKRARDERKQLLAQSSTDKGIEPMATSRKDVNDLVDSLLSSGGRPTSPYQSGQASSIGVSAQPSGRSTPTPSTPGRLSRMSNEGSVSELRKSLASAGQQTMDREELLSPPLVDYVDTHTELYELPSKIVKPETYSKSVQTMVAIEVDDDAPNDDSGGSGRETKDETQTRILAELEEQCRQLEKEVKELKEKAEELKVVDLSREQRQAIFATADFSAFVEESSRIVQRALSDGYDYIKDYTIDSAIDEGEGQKIKLFGTFSDERWTAGRSVTDLDWSPKFPELVVASYNRGSPADPDGIVAVWNLHLLERPEFIFHSPSDVLSVTFSPFHPTLIFGGSYSGQILLWDTRAKHLPVLKTPLSAAGHTYPIYAMKVVGTQNANNLISSSTDGLVCSWQADMLSQPQEALTLTVPTHNKTDEVSITCLDFPEGETSTFWVGTEEGNVYQANRYDRASAKAGLNDVYSGHAGPITGIHFHPSSGSVDFSDLFLTSSVDWTVKLWRGKGHKTPICSFEESGDYVFDVKWHSNHPAMFGTVDGTGKFDIWNLSQNLEVPIVSEQVSARGLNKLAWDKTGRKAGLGSSDGKVYVYDVAEKIVTPRDSDWIDFQKTVQSLSTSGDPVIDAARQK